MLAMSTFPRTIFINDFPSPGGTVIRECQSQLEPVVRYVLSKCASEEVCIFTMYTKETEELKTIGPVQESNGGKRSRQVSDPSETGIKTSAIEFFELRIKESVEYCNPSKCRFDRKLIDLNKPEEAIQVAVERIREYREENSAEPFRLWIDTHGGIRDVALLTNIVGYLLNKFSEIEVAGIYGTEFTNERKDQRIIDQRNAFDSLSFVTGMSDFMNFGNVDVLKEYYQTEISGGDEEIQNLINAMQLVSDGTQFCDPYLYTQGLDALGKAITPLISEGRNAEKALLPIFYNAIREDYGSLLDSKTRTSVDIIERCIEKKQYQQALTFIEALMPEYFFEKHILYFSDEHMEIAEKAAAGFYKTPIANAFDTFMEKMKDCFKNKASSNDIRNCLYVRVGILAGRNEVNEFAVDFSDHLRAEEKDNLRSGMYEDFPIRKMYSLDKKYSKVKFITDVPRPEYKRAGRIMRMHSALKDSRNKFNHAISSGSGGKIEDMRPYLEDVVKVMRLYIDDIRALEMNMENK